MKRVNGVIRSMCGLGIGMSVVAVLSGCGGGGASAGSSSQPSQIRSAGVSAARTVADVETVVGVSGTGRSMHSSLGWRVQIILAALHRGRSTQQGFDFGFYWTATVNDNTGIGRLDLYSDSNRQSHVGNFAWAAPQWSGTQGSYPVRVPMTFNLSTGGVNLSGSMAVTLNDANGSSGILTGQISDGAGNSLSFNITAGATSSSGTMSGQFSDGSSINLSITERSSGGVTATFSSSYGYHGNLTRNADASGSGALYDTGGRQALTMTWDQSGNLTLAFADGSRQTVNIWAGA